MFVVALTGDVGAGKSTFMSLLKGMGARTVSADLVAKGLWDRPHIRREFIKRWGAIPLKSDGSLDAAVISKRVFSSEEEYRFLCAVLHPPAWELLRESVTEDGIWVIEVPLLFESRVPSWVDGAMYLGCPRDLRLSRVMSRGWEEDELISRERWLMDPEVKRGMADWVIDNSGSLEDLARKAREIYGELRCLASVILGNVTFGSREEALSFSEVMVEERLAACCRLRPVFSVYRWNGDVCQDEEVELEFKTVEDRVEDLMKLFSRHAYELPAIYFQRPYRMSLKLRRWVLESCSA